MTFRCVLLDGLPTGRSNKSVSTAISTSILDHSLLLPSIGREDVAAMFAPARQISFASGQTIFVEGEQGDTVMLIERGRAEVSIISASGRKSIIAHMGPGEILGEIAALDGCGRSATVIAATDMSGRTLTRAQVLNYIAERPDVAKAVIVELCRKVRNASDMFANRSVVEGGPRLAKALLRLFDKWGQEAGDAVVLTQQLSQTEIGDFSGLSRENVNRYIKLLVEQSILAYEDRMLVLVDRSQLESLADG